MVFKEMPEKFDNESTVQLAIGVNDPEISDSTETCNYEKPHKILVFKAEPSSYKKKHYVIISPN